MTMCITKLINSILSNYFKPGYYNNVRSSNFLMGELKSSFSKLTKALHNNNTLCESDKKSQILYLEEKQEPKQLNINQQIHRQTLYHNLTCDHGICLLN